MPWVDDNEKVSVDTGLGVFGIVDDDRSSELALPRNRAKVSLSAMLLSSRGDWSVVRGRSWPSLGTVTRIGEEPTLSLPAEFPEAPPGDTFGRPLNRFVAASFLRSCEFIASLSVSPFGAAT